MTFKTAYSRPARSGTKCYKTAPKLYYNSSKDCVCAEELERNFYEEIQSYEQSCRIDTKIRALAMGDSSVLCPGGASGDFSSLPKDARQLIEIQRSGASEFSKLSPGIRALFGDDSKQFESALKDGSYSAKITEYINGQLDKFVPKSNEGGEGQASEGA